MKKAEELGADRIATGHYAGIVERRTNEAPRYLLKKAADRKKDQSYVLYVMKQNELAKTVFPLGEFSKERTRAIARERGLATAVRPESQEICFVGDDDYANFIKGFSPDSVKPGPILDTEGREIGRHKGIAFYTIGQRKGLGISSPVPRYVADINRDDNTIVVGSREDATRSRVTVTDLNWITGAPPTGRIRAGVKVRSTMNEVMATLIPDNENIIVQFDEPQWAPAPGQSAVFYDREIVLGGGIII
jgi:tRNA-specific 2-thiouridylase